MTRSFFQIFSYICYQMPMQGHHICLQKFLRHQPDLAESKSSFDILPCDLDVPLEVTTKVRISGLYPQYKTFIGSLQPVYKQFTNFLGHPSARLHPNMQVYLYLFGMQQNSPFSLQGREIAFCRPRYKCNNA